MTIQLGATNAKSEPVQSNPVPVFNTKPPSRPVQTTLPQIDQAFESVKNQKQRIRLVQMQDVDDNGDYVSMDLG